MDFLSIDEPRNLLTLSRRLKPDIGIAFYNMIASQL